jgi:hypothetical protein
MTESQKEILTTTVPNTKQILELEWIEKLTHYMDNLVGELGTKFRFGVDPLLGTIPFAGELVTFIISAIILLALIRHGTSGKLVVLMLSNVTVDALIGAVPFVGDVFDFAFKANKKNVDLLKQYHQKGKHKGSGLKNILGVLFILLLILILLLYLSSLFLNWSSNFVQPKLL